MDIRLQQVEIEQAVRSHLTNQGINLSGRSMEISFTAGRGATGLTADISLRLPDSPPHGPIPRMLTNIVIDKAGDQIEGDSVAVGDPKPTVSLFGG